MEESAEEMSHREEILRMYHAIKQALTIIGDVTMKTVSTPTPAPVNNDWIPTTSPAYGDAGGGFNMSNGYVISSIYIG